MRTRWEIGESYRTDRKNSGRKNGQDRQPQIRQYEPAKLPLVIFSPGMRNKANADPETFRTAAEFRPQRASLVFDTDWFKPRMITSFQP